MWALSCLAWKVQFGVFRLATLVLNHSLEKLCLRAVFCDLSLGLIHWRLSLGIFCLRDFLMELELRNCLSGISAWELSPGFSLGI